MRTGNTQNTQYRPSRSIIKCQRIDKASANVESASNGMTKNRLLTYPCQGIYKRHYTIFNTLNQFENNMHPIAENDLTMDQPNNFPRQMTHLENYLQNES